MGGIGTWTGAWHFIAFDTGCCMHGSTAGAQLGWGWRYASSLLFSSSKAPTPVCTKPLARPTKPDAMVDTLVLIDATPVDRVDGAGDRAGNKTGAHGAETF